MTQPQINVLKSLINEALGSIEDTAGNASDKELNATMDRVYSLLGRMKRHMKRTRSEMIHG